MSSGRMRLSESTERMNFFQGLCVSTASQRRSTSAIMSAAGLLLETR